MESKTFQLPEVHSQAEAERIRSITADNTTKIFAVEWSEPATWDEIEARLMKMGYTLKQK